MDITIIQRLCEVLDEHLARYQLLADFVGREKKRLLELNLDGLFMASKEKEALALDIHANIGTLVMAINETAGLLGLPLSPQPLLIHLVERLPAPYANRVNDGAIKLERLKNVILRENEANRHYVEEALRLVGESINILTGANQLKGDGYQNNGRRGEKKMTRPVKLSREV
ncbi:MAG: flagellar export chaperone FlgN [Candidatus Adiutrix sp.]|jgi:hypothetical protein|nr:flagellar export chaperone FlgN [Candidatus Adiutrix sp.]